MERIEWKNAYSVDNDIIDGQHKILISKLNGVYDDIISGESDNKIDNILSQLWEYTEYHFSTEEELMKSHNYPDMNEHLEGHMNFIVDLSNIKNGIEGDKYILAMKILDFLAKWLNHHILTIDKKLGAFFKTIN